MEAMAAAYEQFLGSPAVLALLLFIGPFVLEEAAILSGAALAAAEELRPPSALIALYLGTVVSDWMLYALGAAAGSSARIRAWIGPNYIESGRRVLQSGAFGAALLARLVPWLLFPVFVASGFVNVGFARFAAVNAGIALIYVNVLFWSIYGLDLVLFEVFEKWGWAIVLLAMGAVVAISRLVSRRYRGADPRGSDPRRGDCH